MQFDFFKQTYQVPEPPSIPSIVEPVQSTIVYEEREPLQEEALVEDYVEFVEEIVEEKSRFRIYM